MSMLTTLYFQCLFVLFCPSFYDPLFFTLNKTIYLLPFLFLICIPFLSSSSWRCPCQCGLVFYDSNGVGSSLPAPLQLQFIYNLLHPVAKGKARTTLSGPFTWGKKKLSENRNRNKSVIKVSDNGVTIRTWTWQRWIWSCIRNNIQQHLPYM